MAMDCQRDYKKNEKPTVTCSQKKCPTKLT